MRDGTPVACAVEPFNTIMLIRGGRIEWSGMVSEFSEHILDALLRSAGEVERVARDR